MLTCLANTADSHRTQEPNVKYGHNLPFCSRGMVLNNKVFQVVKVDIRAKFDEIPSLRSWDIEFTKNGRDRQSENITLPHLHASCIKNYSPVLSAVFDLHFLREITGQKQCYESSETESNK